MHIEKMTVTGLEHFVERAFRESHKHQFLRELVMNALESGAKEIHITPEWQAVRLNKVYRFMIADNGKGMSPEELIRYMNSLGASGKAVGGVHQNFGIGARTTTLPWNKAGLLVLSNSSMINPSRSGFANPSEEAIVSYAISSLKGRGLFQSSPRLAYARAFFPRACQRAICFSFSGRTVRTRIVLNWSRMPFFS